VLSVQCAKLRRIFRAATPGPDWAPPHFNTPHRSSYRTRLTPPPQRSRCDEPKTPSLCLALPPSLSLTTHTHTHTHSPAATPPPPTSFSDSTCADPPPHGGAAIPRCSRNSEIKPKNSPAKRRGRAPPNKRRQSFASGEGAPADVTPIRGGSAHGSACTRRDLSRAGRDIFATTPRRVPISAPSSRSLPRSLLLLVAPTTT